MHDIVRVRERVCTRVSVCVAAASASAWVTLGHLVGVGGDCVVEALDVEGGRARQLVPHQPLAQLVHLRQADQALE